VDTNTLLSHLTELRQRLLNCLYVLIGIFSVLFYFSDPLFHFLAVPILQHLPPGRGLIAIGVAAPLLTPLKFTFTVAFFLAAPYVLFQLWVFIAPGLYRLEKKIIYPVLMGSLILFYSGVMFAYWIVFPLIFGFFARMAPEGIVFMPDMSQYLDFCLKLLFAFGFVFEVPVAVLLMVYTGVVDIDRLVELRPYVIVAAFIVGMLLTPPDIISQILLAVPICLLFEIGIICAKVLCKRKVLN